jgi:hypothetical protein
MAQRTQRPIVLTGQTLLDALAFTVEGPELSRGDVMAKFEASAQAAVSGFRQYLFDLTGHWAPEEVIAVSGTYPADARLVRTGKWCSNGAPWDWDDHISQNKPFRFLGNVEKESALAFALLLNAEDYPRDLHGMVWGPVETINLIAAEQRQRADHPWTTYSSNYEQAVPPKFQFEYRNPNTTITLEQIMKDKILSEHDAKIIFGSGT